MASIISAGLTSGTSLNLSGDTSGVLQLASNGSTTAVTIDTSQNVGIGTSSPTVKLDVVGAGNLSSRARFTKTGEGILQLGANRDTSTCPYIGSENNYPLAFITNDTERMRIDSSGNVGINYNPAGDGRFVVQAAGASQPMIRLYDSNSGSGSQVQISFRRNSVDVGNIACTNAATAYVTSSDYRLKENIAPMTGALAKIALLNPVTYDWKIGGSSQGFIAHELAKVCPDAVSGEKDAVNADGTIKPQGIDTSFLVATLTAAIQELKAELDATKAEVQALKGTAL